MGKPTDRTLKIRRAGYSTRWMIAVIVSIFSDLGGHLLAEVEPTLPMTLEYQGRITRDDQAFTGDGYFVFAILATEEIGNARVEKVSWTNWEGNQPSGLPQFNVPTNRPQPLVGSVVNGLFTVRLGHSGIPLQTSNRAITPGVFYAFAAGERRVRNGLKLRTWFSSDNETYIELQPDITFASVPYAFVAGLAETLNEKVIIDAAKLAPGAIAGQLVESGGDAHLSSAYSSLELAAAGFAREPQSILAANSDFYIYRYDSTPIARIAIAADVAGGKELPIDADEPVRLELPEPRPSSVVFELRNIGTRPLSGLSFQIEGPDATEFAGILGDDNIPLADSTTLVLSNSSLPLSGIDKSVYLRVSANEFADDLLLPLTIRLGSAFALVPAGSFTLGDSLDFTFDAPTVDVNTSAFYLARHEVSKSVWEAARIWGSANGYPDLAFGTGKSDQHPESDLGWYDVVKWCNARSEMDGLTPCYTLPGGAVYQTGYRDDVICDWNASGYRLPTEIEWEKAARGGLAGKRFPWGDSITHDLANYYSESYYFFDTSLSRGYHPGHSENGWPYTAPIGSFPANSYGIREISGNAWEWCWDYYDWSTYENLSEGELDPRGPGSGYGRVLRGGSSTSYASECRVAARLAASPYALTAGFRPVRRAAP